MSISNYISNRPSFWKRVKDTFEVMGYARAAAELARLGYHTQARNCIMEIKRIKD